MNEKQKRVLEIMRPRELYEAASAGDRKRGSGKWYVTRSAHEKYEPLSTEEVQGLVKRGYLIEKYPGCCALAR